MDRENTIALGNRLLALKQSPGFFDLVQRSAALVKEVNDTLVDFAGWDDKQISALKARAQAAKEFHNKLFGWIEEGIHIANMALAEGYNNQNEPTAVTEADEIREQFFAKLQSMFPAKAETKKEDDMRIAGSY